MYEDDHLPVFYDQNDSDLIDLRITFLTACASGDATRIRECLDLGVDINIKDDEGQFGLLYATAERHVSVCDILLGHPGFDVNNKGLIEATCHSHITLKHDEIVSSLTHEVFAKNI